MFLFILISLISLSIISCSEEKEEFTTSDNTTTTTTSDDSTTSDNTTTTTTLSAPTGLSATGTAGQVTLAWTALSGASSYTMFWGTSTGISSTSTTISNISTNSYSHTGLSYGTTYYYKVATVNSAGTSSLSSEVSAAPTSSDTTAPIIAEVTAISTPTPDTTPNYTFSADEAGSITYGGSCSSSTTSATSGNNTITFTTLSLGTYSDCTIKVTDSIGNVSSTLTVSTFVIRAPFWKQESYIKASNNDSGGDQFGNSVSISVDTLAVGAYRERSNQTTITNGTTSSSNNSLIYPGAVYVYKRSGTSWVQEAYIKAANSDVRDEFSKVSISGDTLVVGVPNEDSDQTTITNGTTASSDNSNSASGAVYVYKRSGTSWVQEAYIKAANNDADDGFGYSISISGDTLAVGAGAEDSNQTTITNGDNASSDNSNSASGAVYVYKRTGTTWVQEAYIKAVNNDASDGFGGSVSLSGDTLVVGASTETSNEKTITNGTTASSNNSNTRSGAVYVYKRTGTSWAQEAYIKAVNNATYALFGASVSISDDTIAVGAYGERTNLTTITNGTTIGSSSGDSTNSGAVYVYIRTGTSWAQEAFIKAVNKDDSDQFGVAVSISGDTLAVGTGNEDSNQTTITNGDNASSDNSNVGSGAVYVYKRTGTTWVQEAYIKAANNDASDGFGWSVSSSGDTVVVGSAGEASNLKTITNGDNASSDNSYNYGGAVYVYTP